MTEQEEQDIQSEPRFHPEVLSITGELLKAEFQETLEKIPGFQTELNRAFFGGSLQTKPDPLFRPKLEIRLGVGEGDDRRTITVSSEDETEYDVLIYHKIRDDGVRTYGWFTSFSIGIAPVDKPEDYHASFSFMEERTWDIKSGKSFTVTDDNATEIKKPRCFQIFSRTPSPDIGGKAAPFENVIKCGKAIAGAYQVLEMLKQYTSTPSLPPSSSIVQ